MNDVHEGRLHHGDGLFIALALLTVIDNDAGDWRWQTGIHARQSVSIDNRWFS